MPAGKAIGEPRAYQVLCRDILQYVMGERKLEPYRDDGIDIIITGSIGETNSFDILLQDESGNLVAAECKRAKDVKQIQVQGFAQTVMWLKEVTRKDVMPFFFTPVRFQRGSILHAANCDIDVILCKVDQMLPNIQLTHKKYDSTLQRIRDDITVYLSGKGMGVPISIGTLTATVTWPDGMEEERRD